MNTARYRKTQQEMEHAFERASVAETSLCSLKVGMGVGGFVGGMEKDSGDGGGWGRVGEDGGGWGRMGEGGGGWRRWRRMGEGGGGWGR